eukprot:TRINITY_DN27070_c0_g1_i2.p1 TRINITY_DN27070_c0_g1~~TRINITY_DN27070_c0_g1_i2.p1  ORF type:complete len:193 (+),score=30.64 TRINITY_DN27070_c0_g1_i2:158-736(+)
MGNHCSAAPACNRLHCFDEEQDRIIESHMTLQVPRKHSTAPGFQAAILPSTQLLPGGWVKMEVTDGAALSRDRVNKWSKDEEDLAMQAEDVFGFPGMSQIIQPPKDYIAESAQDGFIVIGQGRETNLVENDKDAECSTVDGSVHDGEQDLQNFVNALPGQGGLHGLVFGGRTVEKDQGCADSVKEDANTDRS